MASIVCRRLTLRSVRNPVRNSPLAFDVNFTSISAPLFFSSRRSSSISEHRKKSSVTFTRRYSSHDASTSSEISPNSQQTVVYTSPFGALLKRLKILSLTSSFAGGVGFPILVSMVSTGLPIVAQTALVGSMMFTSIGTTALLHYVVKGYIVELTSSTPLQFLDGLSEDEIQTQVLSEEGKEKLRLSWCTYDLFGNKRWIRNISLSELQPPLWSPHPLVTFSYQSKNYFVHSDRISPQLLIALSKTLPPIPQPPSPPSTHDTSTSSVSV